MGFDVRNNLNPILTGALSLQVGQAQHDQHAAELEAERAQRQQQLDQEFAVRHEQLAQQREQSAQQAHESQQRIALAAQGQTLDDLNRQAQIGAQQRASSNSTYAGLIGQLLSSDRADQAQQQTDARQQALFGQQQQLQQDRDQQQEIMQGLKAGTLRYSPQQKTEMNTLQAAMDNLDRNPQFSPEQKAQGHAYLEQQMHSIRPMQVPMDELPPDPQEQFNSQVPLVTDHNGRQFRVTKDRNGRTIEFITEQEKAEIKLKNEQQVADLKTAHGIAEKNATYHEKPQPDPFDKEYDAAAVMVHKRHASDETQPEDAQLESEIEAELARRDRLRKKAKGGQLSSTGAAAARTGVPATPAGGGMGDVLTQDATQSPSAETNDGYPNGAFWKNIPSKRFPLEGGSKVGDAYYDPEANLVHVATGIDESGRVYYEKVYHPVSSREELQKVPGNQYFILPDGRTGTRQ